jgi:hypothetical protein
MAKKNSSSTSASGSFAANLISVGEDGAMKAVVSAGAKAAELVEAWVAAKNAAAVAAVARDDGAPAPARKAARRGINVLKARGVAVPERNHVVHVAAKETEQVQAWFLPPDASGATVVIVGAHAPTGRYRIAQVVLRDVEGVVQVRSFDLSGSQLSGYLDETEKRSGSKPPEVPVQWARARIAAAREQHKKHATIEPLGLDSVADLVGPAPAGTVPHPIDEAKIDPAAAAGAIAESAQLHGEPEFRGWLPSGESIRMLLEKIGQGIGPQGDEPHDPAKIEAAVSEALKNATDQFFAPDVREIVASRMKDAAISVLSRAGRDRAAAVLATAAAVTSAGLITSPPHEVPFLQGFFQKALAVVAAQQGGQLSVPVPDASAPAAAPTKA